VNWSFLEFSSVHLKTEASRWCLSHVAEQEVRHCVQNRIPGELSNINTIQTDEVLSNLRINQSLKKVSVVLWTKLSVGYSMKRDLN